MQRSLFVALLAVLFTFAVASAQSTGKIILTGDQAGANCDIIENPSGVTDVHMLVVNDPTISAVQFAAPQPSCWVGATWLSDVVSFTVFVGNTQLTTSGLAVGFGGCFTAPVYIGRMVFQTTGSAEMCCNYPVIKATADGHPEFDGPLKCDCGPPFCNELEISAGSAVVNPDPSCTCMLTVPTEDKTWGAIKDMYR